MVMVKLPVGSRAEELLITWTTSPSLTEPEMAVLQPTATATACKVNLLLLGMLALTNSNF